mgnify:FL=1
MASIKKIEGKTGTSYKITVTKGTDSHGKQIRHFMTWKPDRPMTARQMEKEVQRVAVEFEREIELGYRPDDRQTFEQYAKYVIDLKERQGRAKNTIATYWGHMQKVSPFIGHMKLSEIRPQHINALYRELSKPGSRRMPDTMELKVDLAAEIGQNRREFAKSCGIYNQAIYKICAEKRASREFAERIAQAMGRPVSELFKPAHTAEALSPNSIRRIHSFLSTVFTQAENEMLITYNPASKATPPAADKHEVVCLQPDTLSDILDALESEDIKHRTMAHLLIVTGCRKGEITALKWEKVDFENRQIKIDVSLSYVTGIGVLEGPTKTKKARFVTIPAETAALLRKYRAWQMELRLNMGDQWNDTGYVFTRDNGLPSHPRMIDSWLRNFSKRHGLPYIYPHMFRHTCASILISEGVDIVTVSKMLGHANTNVTTNVYSHEIEEAKRKATECIADVMLRKKRA